MDQGIRISPNIAFKAALLGAVLLVFFTSAISTGASPTVLQASDNNEQTQDENSDEITADADEQAPHNDCHVSQNFPKSVVRWCELITFYADKNNLPADLVAALIWQESGGKPGAYSRSGAVGLMQIMPRDGIAATFQCVNGPCFSNRPSIKELEDPEFNIKYGTNMLARLIKKRGNLRDALKSYGPMDVGYSYADKVLSLYRQYGN